MIFQNNGCFLNAPHLPLVRKTDSLTPLVELMLLCLCTQLNIAKFLKHHSASAYALQGNQATNRLQIDSAHYVR